MERRASKRLSLNAQLAIDEQAQQEQVTTLRRTDKANAIHRERLQSTTVEYRVDAILPLNQQLQWAPLNSETSVLTSKRARRKVVDSQNVEARLPYNNMAKAGTIHGYGAYISALSPTSCFALGYQLDILLIVFNVANHTVHAQGISEWSHPSNAICKHSRFNYDDILLHNTSHNKRMPYNAGPVPPHDEPTGTTALPCIFPLCFLLFYSNSNILSQLHVSRD